MKDVISIKYRWNTIAWGRIMHLGQDLLGVKIHTSCKISKLFRGTKSQNFSGAQNLALAKFLEFVFF